MASHAAIAPAHRRGTPRSYALALLVLVYTFNFIDRSIVNILGQAIKKDLGLSDAQLGLLSGISFAILYSTLAIPIARLAERYSRVAIIAISLALWSGFTAACGLAAGFAGLFLARVGVGIGEAGCSPAAQSLISDYYPPERRSTALSIYSLGLPLGMLFGAVAGGWLAQSFGWRAAFAIVGLPGIALAIITAATVREPPRGTYDAGEPAGSTPPLGEVVGRLLGRPAFVPMLAGVTLAAFGLYGSGAFLVPFLLRGEFGLDLARAATGYGVFVGLASAAGVALGGLLTDWAGARDRRMYAAVPGFAFLAAGPLFAAALLQHDLALIAALMIAPLVFQNMFFGPTYAITHNMVEPRMRASATALLFLPATFLGLGFGPPFVGWLSDLIAHSAFHAEGIAGSFAALCPGGSAPAAAPEALAPACRAASFAGVKWALVATLGAIYPLAALFYLRAARTLDRDMTAMPGETA
jgi:predicted MFS family arabinose efflux permease